ncbi:ABC transporter ATP-binding protein [Acidocella aminolytica]|uniref:ABC transporter O-antigene exporter ATP-binding protein n=1 Tax=Acidocella aminolytica 101 = DSM 11237 TaxID=1120923 RepID=A0A0D6PBS7_9PROT|nr:ABC transporter ATP-binding protein [Acidocella aminolytica]GAN78816.1 ABC transporter O-antigene exporter ATP-binding protein [Acidocella aminolytica 101 = DSM 11237]GBQ34908.1 O-antigen exporter ATP-binding protein [Acidocella aminolytica 101 = DSM 11237]SHE86637.1 lipopolysaccharide transport system ATP-binding protein [Acidocella aminolytica 101 = DSM 11237]
MAKLQIENVSVSFPLYHGESRSLKKTVFAAASGRMGQDSKHRITVEALRDVSFALGTGDRLGFIGSNGAGKTTLLRTMAGIYEPVNGKITIEGRVTALLDPGQGMNFELTGNENIRLRALFSGYSEAQIKKLQEDVAQFADLGEFLSLPVRTYSSGMVVRLGFALATAIHPQILLMDEWILAGDAAFLGKARERLETMVGSAEILVLSSHNPAILMQWCNRLIWMEGGRIRMDGAPEEILAAYLPPDQFQQAKAAAEQVAAA